LGSESFYCPECGKPTSVPTTPSTPRKHTQLGVMPQLSIPERVAAPDDEIPERTTDLGISQPTPGQMGRTMLGIPQRPADAQTQAVDDAKPASGKVSPKTMLGMPGLVPPAATPAPPKQVPARTLIGGPESMAAGQAAVAAMREHSAAQAAEAQA
jgi:hypothetical protein